MTYSGTITNSSGVPIEMALVTDNYVADYTSAAGNFSLTTDRSPLTVAATGYVTRTISPVGANVGTISLEDDPRTHLDAVEVVANRPSAQAQVKPSKKKSSAWLWLLLVAAAAANNK
jgi:hypothetical protein